MTATSPSPHGTPHVGDVRRAARATKAPADATAASATKDAIRAVTTLADAEPAGQPPVSFWNR
jgi:hypothetical protein